MTPTSRPACLVYGLALGALLTLWFTRPHPTVITPADIAFQRGNPDAGIAEATPVTQRDLDLEIAAAVDGGMPDPKAFARKHGAASTALLKATGTLPAITSADGAFSHEPLDFRVTATVLRQQRTGLQTAQVSVQELRDGKPIGQASLQDVEFHYLPAPSPPQWQAEAMLGLNLPGVGQPVGIGSGPFAFGVAVRHRFAGRFWAGGWLISSGQVGGSVGAEW